MPVKSGGAGSPLTVLSSVMRMMPISTVLAVHLTLFHKIYRIIEVKIDILSSDYKALHEQGKPNRPKDLIASDMRLIHEHFSHAVNHGTCAEKLIKTLILSRFPMWHRLRQALRPSSEEKECIKSLTKRNH